MSDPIELTLAFSLKVKVDLCRIANNKPEKITRKPTVTELSQIVRDVRFLAIQLKGEVLNHSIQNGERRFTLNIPQNQEDALRKYLLDNDDTEILLPKTNNNKKITWPNFIRFVPQI